MALRHRWRPVSALVVLTALVVSACGKGSSPSLTSVTAGKTTVAAGSFRLAIDERIFEKAKPSNVEQHSVGNGFVDLAESRSRITTTQKAPASTTGEAGETEQIKIGTERWIRGAFPIDALPESPLSGSSHSVPEGPKPWLHIPSSAGSTGAGAPLGFDPTTLLRRLDDKGAKLRAAGHEQVRGVPADHYEVMAPTATTTTNEVYGGKQGFDVWIDRSDLVRRLQLVSSIRAQPDDNTPPTPERTLEVTIEFFDFGAHEDVQPPPADQVADLPPTSDCTASGLPAGTVPGLQFCSDNTPSAPESVPALPPPKVDGSPALDFRPVTSERAGPCPVPPAASAPDQPVTLPSVDGSCLELAPSGLTVTRAEVVAGTGPGNSVEASFTLDKKDAVAFDRLAAANVGQRVAIVMFGRVLSAPVIQQAGFNGRGVITGLDPQDAADVIAALSR